MLYDYYALLGRNGHNYNDYYVENGILDASTARSHCSRGMLLQAHIEPSAGAMPMTGKFHMLLTN